MPLKRRGKYWHYEFMLHGQRYWGSTKETNVKRAQTFEALKLADAQRGILNPLVSRIPTLTEFAKDFIDYVDGRFKAHTMSKKMREQYQQGWRLLKTTAIKDKPINQITQADASILTFPGGPWTARSAQKTLKRILTYAAEMGRIQAAPRILLSKADGRMRLISPEESEALMKHMSPDMRDLYIVAKESGQRPDEIMRMEWVNVHWDRDAIFVPNGKTKNARRFVPLTDLASEVLRERQKTAKCTWVFPGKTKEGRRRTVAKAFRKARAAAGISPDVVLYLVRHTFCTNLIAETNNLALVQKVMGHESITTTQKYLHPETEGVAKTINKMNKRNARAKARKLQLVA